MINKILLSFLLILSFTFVNAQYKIEESENNHVEKKHSIVLLISHTQLPEGVENGEKKWISLPSWGIDYNFEINERWAIGLHNDIVVESFAVEHFDGTEIERSTPFASAFVGLFKPVKNLSLVLGAGGEFSKEENLFLVKAGVEYAYRFHSNWELLASLTNDLKINSYNSWSIGLGVARKF
jgi:hypothetical protein